MRHPNGRDTNSMSTDVGITPFYYYAARLTGVLPLAGGRGADRTSAKTAWLAYSAVLWACMVSSGVHVNVRYYALSGNVLPKHRIIVKIVFIEVLSKLTVSLVSMAISAARSSRLFGLLDRLRRFDERTLRLTCPPDTWTQAFYLFYVCAAVVHDTINACLYTDFSVFEMIVWNVLCVSTMLAVVQYVTYVKELGDRYELANRIFANSTTGHRTVGTKYIHPREINTLFIELRGLTEDIKTFYAYHSILLIAESTLIMVSGVTTLTINYLQLDAKYVHTEYFVVHCSLKLLFLFFVVREMDGTACELEVIMLNCWNHPIKFDVLDFFDLDYKLLQSIVASVVTYVVVLVQIQFAIMAV